VREILEGKQLPIKKTFNKHIVKVHLVEVLKEPDYFMK